MPRVDQRCDVMLAQARGAGSEDEVAVSPLVNRPGFRQLVEWFVNGLDLRLDDIEQAWRNSCWDELATLAHQLKGAGASYGYPAISRAAETLEQAARQQETDEISDAFARLRDRCGAAAQGLNALPPE